jgi:hypothetical protein
MKTYSLRFLALLIALTVGLLIHRGTAVPNTSQPVVPSGAHEPDTIPSTIQQSRSNEILSLLLPNDGSWADVSQLEKFERSEAIKTLKAAELNASGDRALSIAFLLAVLKQDYEVNRSKLLTALSEYRRREYPQKLNCAECISGYLVELAQRGDTSLYTPLVEVSDLADGALAESLGVFYSDALSRHTKEFVGALTPLSEHSQDLVCDLASREDGGGMADETFKTVKRSLNALGRQNGRLAVVAKRCVITLQRGKRQADANRKALML